MSFYQRPPTIDGERTNIYLTARKNHPEWTEDECNELVENALNNTYRRGYTHGLQNDEPPYTRSIYRNSPSYCLGYSDGEGDRLNGFK